MGEPALPLVDAAPFHSTLEGKQLFPKHHRHFRKMQGLVRNA